MSTGNGVPRQVASVFVTVYHAQMRQVRATFTRIINPDLHAYRRVNKEIIAVSIRMAFANFQHTADEMREAMRRGTITFLHRTAILSSGLQYTDPHPSNDDLHYHAPVTTVLYVYHTHLHLKVHYKTIHNLHNPQFPTDIRRHQLRFWRLQLQARGCCTLEAGPPYSSSCCCSFIKVVVSPNYNYLITPKYMEQGRVWETDNHSVGPEIPHRLRNPKVC
jgi:hypothetical protein